MFFSCNSCKVNHAINEPQNIPQNLVNKQQKKNFKCKGLIFYVHQGVFTQFFQMLHPSTYTMHSMWLVYKRLQSYQPNSFQDMSVCLYQECTDCSYNKGITEESNNRIISFPSPVLPCLRQHFLESDSMTSLPCLPPGNV